MSEEKPEDNVEVIVTWTETVEYAKTVKMTRAKFHERDSVFSAGVGRFGAADFLDSIPCSNGDWQDGTVSEISGFDLCTDGGVEETSEMDDD